MTMFSSTSPFSSLTCGGIHTEKKKRQKKSFFIYGTTFKKNESGRDFQRGQIWNDRSQKQKKKKKLAKHNPPRTTNIPAHPRFFIYYSTQTMSRAIFILSIFRSHGFFLVIPPHRVKNAVHLRVPDQFIFSYTTPVGFFTFITRHLSYCYFFYSPEIINVSSLFSAVFFYR